MQELKAKTKEQAQDPSEPILLSLQGSQMVGENGVQEKALGRTIWDTPVDQQNAGTGIST